MGGTWWHNGCRVAVIGSAAGAVQFIPESAPRVAELTIYQRTATGCCERTTGPADTLICATGFHRGRRLSAIDVTGRDGCRLDEPEDFETASVG